MIIAEIENQIRYVTNADGETTDVLVPVELWHRDERRYNPFLQAY